MPLAPSRVASMRHLVYGVCLPAGLHFATWKELVEHECTGRWLMASIGLVSSDAPASPVTPEVQQGGVTAANTEDSRCVWPL